MAAVVFVAIGGFLDSLLFSNPDPEAYGHGFPVFTLLFFLAAAVISVIVLIVALVGFFLGLQQRSREESR